MNTVLEGNLCAGGSHRRLPFPPLPPPSADPRVGRGARWQLVASCLSTALLCAAPSPGVAQFALAGKARDRTGNFRTF